MYNTARDYLQTRTPLVLLALLPLLLFFYNTSWNRQDSSKHIFQKGTGKPRNRHDDSDILHNGSGSFTPSLAPEDVAFISGTQTATPVPTAFPSVTPTEEESQTIASLSTLLGYEKYIYNAGDKYGYRKYQDAPFFPDGYTSKLYRVGEYLGISVPDIYDRHRQMNTISSEFQRSSRYGVCPPHDLPPHGESLPSPSKPSGFYPPTLDALSTSTVGLVLVTYNAVDTLRNTLQSWEEAGILGLFDDRVMFANDPYEEEIQLGLEHGFRIFTPRAQDLTRLMDARQSILSEILRGEQPRYGSFPHLKPGREPNNPDSVRTFVGPAQLLSYLELRTDYVVFAEKDYMLAPHQTLESIVRTLLASVSLLQRNTRVVRLRRTDHPEDPKTIPNCCNRGCGGSYNAFYKSCEWSSHLNWLALYCDKQGIETLSRGQMLHCMNERETLKDYVIGANPRGHPVLQLPRTKDATILRQWEQYEESEQDSHRMEDPIAQMTRDEVENMQVEPLEMYCVSMDHSNWSNNIAMFEREWWINVLGIGAIQTEPDNGMFEVNMINQGCKYAPRHKLGSGADGAEPAMVCILTPGLFWHYEINEH